MAGLQPSGAEDAEAGGALVGGAELQPARRACLSDQAAAAAKPDPASPRLPPPECQTTNLDTCTHPPACPQSAGGSSSSPAAAAQPRRRRGLLLRLELPGSTPLPPAAVPPPRLLPAMRLPLEGEAATRLAIFATRPGILCLPLNLLTEFLATGVFVLLLLMLWQQARFMGARPPAIRRWAEPLIIAAC